MKFITTIYIVQIIFVLIGCSDNSVINDDYNFITVRSVNDTLQVVLTGTRYTKSQDADLYFLTDTVHLALNVSGYGGGSGIFKLYKDTVLIYSKDLSSGMFFSEQKTLYSRPTKASINLTNYNGHSNISVTK